MEQRKELQWFANEMEAKLKKNDHKGGWSKINVWQLVVQLKNEVTELEHALVWEESEHEDLTEVSDKVTSECADVANFAMMIADNIAALRQPVVSGQLCQNGCHYGVGMSGYCPECGEKL